MPYFISMLIPTKIAYFPLGWKVVSSGKPGKELAAESFQVFPYSLFTTFLVNRQIKCITAYWLDIPPECLTQRLLAIGRKLILING